ncbi:MAG: hypothetical protein KDN05_23095, partial [Verrucomicrobiae bacterium]|nr:hypothetical protein [Verrucomicrobiae bacterium]
MKATIETDRRAKLVSWTVAAVVTIAGALLIALMPEPDNSKVRLAEPEKPKLEKPKDEEKNKKPLPEELVEARIHSSEVVVKKELRKRLELFEEIDRDVATKLNSHLKKIESRPLHEGARPENNDTNATRASLEQTAAALGGDASVEDLYDQLATFEDRILQNHLANLAAARALQQGTSFPDVLGSMQQSSTRMPGFESLVDAVRKQHGITGDILPPPGRRSTDDINRYRDLLAQTTRQSGLAESRLLGLVSKVGRKPPPQAQAQGSKSKSDGDGGMEVEGSTMRKALYNLHEPKFESEELVAAQALPGRRFSRDSERRGWLYVN